MVLVIERAAKVGILESTHHKASAITGFARNDVRSDFWAATKPPRIRSKPGRANSNTPRAVWTRHPFETVCSRFLHLKTTLWWPFGVNWLIGCLSDHRLVKNRYRQYQKQVWSQMIVSIRKSPCDSTRYGIGDDSVFGILLPEMTISVLSCQWLKRSLKKRIILLMLPKMRSWLIPVLRGRR